MRSTTRRFTDPKPKMRSDFMTYKVSSPEFNSVVTCVGSSPVKYGNVRSKIPRFSAVGGFSSPVDQVLACSKDYDSYLDTPHMNSTIDRCYNTDTAHKMSIGMKQDSGVGQPVSTMSTRSQRSAPASDCTSAHVGPGAYDSNTSADKIGLRPRTTQIRPATVPTGTGAGPCRRDYNSEKSDSSRVSAAQTAQLQGKRGGAQLHDTHTHQSGSLGPGAYDTRAGYLATTPLPRSHKISETVRVMSNESKDSWQKGHVAQGTWNKLTVAAWDRPAYIGSKTVSKVDPGAHPRTRPDQNGLLQEQQGLMEKHSVYHTSVREGKEYASSFKSSGSHYDYPLSVLTELGDSVGRKAVGPGTYDPSAKETDRNLTATSFSASVGRSSIEALGDLESRRPRFG